jgi:hypothetical protein
MKKNITKTILGLAFLLAFNIIYYTTGGTDRTASCWIAYAFIHVSYFLMVLFCEIAGREDKMVELELPLVVISLIYFLANLVLGSLVIIISPSGVKFCIIMEVIMLAIYLVFICTILLANKDTMEQVKQSQAKKR